MSDSFHPPRRSTVHYESLSHEASSVSIRPLISPHDQGATFVELFFDLVFVFGITQVTALLHHGLGWTSVGEAILVFWLIWWGWTQYTWAFNAADTAHPVVEFSALIATAIAFFMAVSVPDAFTGGAIWFAGPYVALRLVGLALYATVMWQDDVARKAVGLFASASLMGFAAVGIGAFWTEHQALFWGLAIALDVVAAMIAARRSGWGIHPDHFAERHGLIVIIALGESLIVVAGGLAGAERTPALLTVGFLAVAITCGLWWTYFPVAKPELEQALQSASEQERAPLARDAFSLAHFPMLCGVIAYAIAIEEAVAHPSDPLTDTARLALALGLLFFVGGLAFALWRARLEVRVGRIVVTVVTSGAVYIVADVSAAVSLGIAFSGVAAVAFLEERTAERMQIGPV